MSLDTAIESLRAANPAPDTRLLRDESEDLAVLLTATWQRSTNMQTQQPQKAKPPQKQNRRGWLVAVAAFVVVLVLGAVALVTSTSTDAPPATTPTTQALPTTTETPPTTEAAFVPAVPRTIEIEAFDYGYSGFDTDFKAGDVLELFNSSESEYHSLIVIKFSDDYPVNTVEEVLALDPLDLWLNQVVDNFGRRLHAAPGATAKGRIRLQTPGTYIALDWIPQNADPEDVSRTINPDTGFADTPPFQVAGGPLGYQQGMIVEFIVTE